MIMMMTDSFPRYNFACLAMTILRIHISELATCSCRFLKMVATNTIVSHTVPSEAQQTKSQHRSKTL